VLFRASFLVGRFPPELRDGAQSLACGGEPVYWSARKGGAIERQFINRLRKVRC
jgi:hypothetical protein